MRQRGPSPTFIAPHVGHFHRRSIAPPIGTSRAEMTPVASSSVPEVEVDAYRLPRTVIPTRYVLTLEPDIAGAIFSGQEAVSVEILEPVSEIVLNALALEIDEAWIEQADGGERRAATVTLDKSTERAHLALDRVAEPGAWVLHARFRGVLNDRLVGFYRSTFTDHGGPEQAIAVTQLEATHAREAFPCWDEPDFKAVFSVTLVVPDGLTALSNAGELSNQPLGDGRRQVVFADTMKMSTYLVAFVVGPLALTPPVDVNNTPLRIAHLPGKEHLTTFAIESASFGLQFFADYYGIVYPGDKCDLVAVPDFAFGAMENLGCITFREVLLLVDPKRATHPELQNVADVIHHELAHMWFGDLVTMKWWNGIWLNEAFATFMEIKCSDAFRPDWNVWVNFGLSRTAAFDVDSLSSTRPIEFEVVSPRDAEGMFDVLTYEKGAAVLRMLEQYLGETEFRDGIRHYLTTHQFGNTETTDLWDAIETSTGEPVRQIMDSWIFQGGYPVVEVELVGPRTLRLRQERFRFAVDDERAANDEPLWAIPIRFTYSDGNERSTDRVLLSSREQDVELPADVDWVHVDTGGSGFYRTRYVGELRRRLTAHVGELLPLERYNLIDHEFACTLAGTSTAAEFCDLARSFGDDTELSVWQRLSTAFAALDRIIDVDTRPRLQATVRAIAAPALHRMGWSTSEGEADVDRQRRSCLFELLGTTGADDDVRARARSLHEAYLKSSDDADPELVAAALTVIADSGTADEFQAFVARWRGADNPQEELRYLYALPRFHDDASFDQLLELSLTEVRTQNAPFLLGRALTNRTHGPRGWEFVRKNWSAILERFPSSTIVRMAEGVKWLTDAAPDVEAFFAEHPVPQGTKTLAQHLERLRVNVAFKEREHAALAKALSS
ncbi:MAG: puromycin-sensitive aminopeptidase [Acidimicrobiaceae bacterium]|jgi:puromycin-sensitive aminopeptidase